EASDLNEADGRWLPIGAEVAAGGVHFRVWAPRRRRVEVVREGRPARTAAEGGSTELAAGGDGYFSGCVPGRAAGDRYRLRLDGEDARYADPASRYQPEGPHGPSQVVDPAAFAWTDGGWRGVRLEGQVIYEVHIGTFTPEGTFAAATREE